ncbi:MAG: Cu(I)/Ag(I) efflux system membrane fusion protein, partial [Mariniblastus sp.]
EASVRVAPTNLAQRSGFDMSLEIFKLFLIPVLIVGAFAIGLLLLGLAQRNDWIESASAGNETGEIGKTSEETDVSYICPMMCVPPTNKPGRCPVCAMELVPAARGSSSGPSSTIEIDPRSRRVAGIKTTVATLQTLSREINSVGEIKYDETQQKTLSAYIDGRIEELTADYTGIEVKKGESLGLLYSPDLYSAQVEYVKTLEFNEKSNSSNSRVRSSNERLLKSSRQRLVELGLTEPQIKNLESGRVAQRTLDLYAPISGTVIEKMATPGQYIKAGAPIYRLADLSKVWLVLQLFPEDAKAIQLGQIVTATTQSLGSESFEGTVEFIEPTVDLKMRTVGVRVAINNEKGFLKPGEFAQATLTIPLAANDGVPQETVVIPRNSLLSIGQTSLAYVETKPGEFQIRKIKTGPSVNGMVAVFEGIDVGENVVSKSTFLLDAQMQLQGNPSLIDPDKAVVDEETQLTETEKEEIRQAMEPLSNADRTLAEAQVICPVTEVRLGSMGMGTPIKLEIEGRSVFICCEGCRDGWLNDPAKHFKILDDYLSRTSTPPELTDAEKDEINKAMETLSEEDRTLAEAQVICPVTEVRLGSMGMGTPVKLEIEGRTVFVCCEGCRDGLLNEPDKFFKILDDYLSEKTKTQNGEGPTPIRPTSNDDELPQMQLPQMELPKGKE